MKVQPDLSDVPDDKNAPPSCQPPLACREEKLKQGTALHDHNPPTPHFLFKFWIALQHLMPGEVQEEVLAS